MARAGRDHHLPVTTGLLQVEQQAALAPQAQEKASKRATRSPCPTAGMTLAALSEERRQSMGLGEDATGVLVVAVEPGSAAAEAGVSAGDVIASVNLADVETPAAVIEAVEL